MSVASSRLLESEPVNTGCPEPATTTAAAASHAIPRSRPSPAATSAPKGREVALAGVLGWLGDRVTGPVLDHLGYTITPPAGAPWPRVWWCPSGALSLLPLHAAGHHDLSAGPSACEKPRIQTVFVPDEAIEANSVSSGPGLTGLHPVRFQ